VTWFSVPAAARCARGFPIGTNNCSIAYNFKFVKTVTGACYVNSTYNDPNLNPPGPTTLCTSRASRNYTMIGTHIAAVLDPSNTLCPDVTSTLPPLPDELM
jgi:hypothetical protein